MHKRKQKTVRQTVFFIVFRSEKLLYENYKMGKGRDDNPFTVWDTLLAYSNRWPITLFGYFYCQILRFVLQRKEKRGFHLPENDHD